MTTDQAQPLNLNEVLTISQQGVLWTMESTRNEHHTRFITTLTGKIPGVEGLTTQLYLVTARHGDHTSPTSDVEAGASLFHGEVPVRDRYVTKADSPDYKRIREAYADALARWNDERTEREQRAIEVAREALAEVTPIG